MRRSRGRGVPFVGRVEERAALRDAFDACCEGQFVVVLLSGDAGVGKTAVVEEFTAELEAEGVPVHWGRCDEVGGAPPFWPWIQILRSMGDEVVAAAQARLGRGAAEPFVAFDTMHEVLLSRGPGPRVLVIEDLHASDLPTLKLLRFLARSSDLLPVLVLATHRGGALRIDPERDVLIGRVAEHARQVEVPVLRSDDVRALLDGHVDGDLLDELAEELWARTGGNAMYVEELVDAICRGGPEELHRVPDGIRAAVRTRLAPLSPLTVQLLSAASVLGAPFAPETVATMLDRDPLEVDIAIEEAVAGDILDWIGDGLSFEHALVRDAVADQLTPARRRALHLAAARALIVVNGTRGDVPASAPAAAIAQHMLDAGWLVEPAEAARWADAAASGARALGAPGEVARWLEAAAERWGAAGEIDRQADALEGAARARVMAADAPGALELSERLAQLGRRNDSGVLLAQAALVRAEVFQPTQEVDAPPLLHEALDHPDTARDPVLRSRLLAATASLLGMPSIDGARQDEEGARKAIAELRVLAADGDPIVAAQLADARLNVDSGPAHLDARRSWLAELDELMPPGPSVLERLNRTYWATSLAFEVGDLAEVERRLREWDMLAERIDSNYWRWRATVARASLTYARGDLEEAERIALASQPLVATLNPRMGLRVLGGFLFTIRRDQGRLRELVGAGPDAFGPLGCLISVEVGDLDDARRRLDEVAKVAGTTGPDDLYWLCLQSVLAFGAEAVGDVDRCAEVALALAPYVGQTVMWGRSFVFGTPVAESLGVARRGAGDRPGAAAAFRLARAWATHAGAVGPEVRASVGLASVLPAEDPERSALLREARPAAARLGMGLALSEIDLLEGTATGDPGASLGAGAGEALSPLSRPEVPTHARVRTLGRFEVWGAGATEPARWSSRKARDALKVLIARRGRAIPREQLIDLLWPDIDVATARNRLSQVLSMVRGALDPDRRLSSDPLRADRQAVALDLDLVDVDTEAFFASARRGLDAAAKGDPRALALLSGAAQVADRGGFLAEDPYADWAEATRAEVARTHRDVLRTAARIAEGRSPDEAISWWARLHAEDPDDEDAVRSLVALLDATGRHGEAASLRDALARRRRSLGLSFE